MYDSGYYHKSLNDWIQKLFNSIFVIKIKF